MCVFLSMSDTPSNVFRHVLNLLFCEKDNHVSGTYKNHQKVKAMKMEFSIRKNQNRHMIDDHFKLTHI